MKSAWKECSELHAQAERQLNALKKRCCRASKAGLAVVLVLLPTGGCACSTRQCREALGLCRARRHRLRPVGAEVALWNDAAPAHRQESPSIKK